MELDYYQAGLERLEQAIGKDREKLEAFDNYKSQLMHLFDDQRSNGSDDRIRHDITKVLGHLNQLSRDIFLLGFIDLCAESRQRNTELDNLDDPSSFDLDEWDRTLDPLFLSNGLKGIAVVRSEDSARNFPRFLQKRLQLRLEEWGRGEVFVAPSFSLKASFGSIDTLIDGLLPYKLRLKTSDILLKIIVDDEERLARFWGRLTSEFDGIDDFCFLVLIIKEPEIKLPESIQSEIPSPDFTHDHVLKWVVCLANKLSNDRKEKARLVQDWAESITHGCTQDRKLHTDRVYEHLELALKCLKTKRSVAELYKFFKEWEQIYAQTPP